MVGEFTILVYFSGDLDVHWGYDLDFDPWPNGCGCGSKFPFTRVPFWVHIFDPQPKWKAPEKEEEESTIPDSECSKRVWLQNVRFFPQLVAWIGGFETGGVTSPK